jgi:hypothetical protein
MLPYFAAAGHWHYFRFATVYLIKMTKLPKDLLVKSLNGEQAMRNQNGIWNSIWSGMALETTVMRYGHGPAGMIGITLNERALDRWATSLHLSSVMEKCFLDLNESSKTKDVTHHKEEGSSRIVAGGKDRYKICNFLTTCIDPFSDVNYPPKIVNVHTGRLSNKDVNVDKCVDIG